MNRKILIISHCYHFRSDLLNLLKRWYLMREKTCPSNFETYNFNQFVFSLALTLSIPLTIKGVFVDSEDQDQTAQNVKSDL